MQFRKLLILFVLVLGLLAAFVLARNRQEIRKKAEGSGEVQLSLQTTLASLTRGQSMTVNVMMKNTSPNKTINAAGVDLQFDPAAISVTNLGCGTVLPTAPAGVTKVENNKIFLTCYTGGNSSYTMVTNADVRLGSFTVTALSNAPIGPTNISFTRTNIVDSTTFTDISNSGANLIFSIAASSAQPTVTPSPSPTVQITLTPTVTLSPSGYCTSDAACRDNEKCTSNNCTDVSCPLEQPVCQQYTVRNHTCERSNLANGTTCSLTLGAGKCQNGNCILDPSATAIPPSATAVVTPPSGKEGYTVDIGGKQTLTINIGASGNTQIRFKAKLDSLRSFPEMYLKLRVKDDLAFMSNPSSGNTHADTCNTPSASDKDFLIPVKAEGEVYSPVTQISQSPPSGATVAKVGADGWITLDGISAGKYYTFYLKGPKTRKGKMAEHIKLETGTPSLQDFDWTGKPLDPGDLPDPNNGDKQDCTINSTDWSLEKARIGANDATNLAVCDVNYDNICNAGDSVAILETLGKRPDDDQ